MKRGAMYVLAAGLLLGLPLLGAWAVGLPLDRLLEFPPRSQYVSHAPFSWIAFVAYAAFILAWVLPFAIHAVRGRVGRPVGRSPRRFPWWGWVGVGLMAAGWVLAWTRFAWLSALQRHTFLPLWIAYILVVNGLAVRRTGRCLMLDRPRFFLVLFPASAAFWWFFEYLNRFVQNWVYEGARYGPAGYCLNATLAFSTVLAAVLSTRELLLSVDVFQKFRAFQPIRLRRPKLVALGVLVVTSAGLAHVGVFPNHLFSLLWVAPLLIVVSVQVLFGRRHVLCGIADGDWRPVVAAAAAALVCGLFWETWNYYSLAKWTYHVPLVGRFFLFEMPVLGFAGYLPFGVECAVAGAILGGEDADRRCDPG